VLLTLIVNDNDCPGRTVVGRTDLMIDICGVIVPVAVGVGGVPVTVGVDVGGVPVIVGVAVAVAVGGVPVIVAVGVIVAVPVRVGVGVSVD